MNKFYKYTILLSLLMCVWGSCLAGTRDNNNLTNPGTDVGRDDNNTMNNIINNGNGTGIYNMNTGTINTDVTGNTKPETKPNNINN